MLLADLVSQLFELLAAEFDHLSRLHADEIIVRLPARNDFVIRLLVVEEDLLENARVMEMVESAINRRPTDAMADLFQVVDELLGLEQAGLAQCGVEDHGALRREL